jgi:hypothetical protein
MKVYTYLGNGVFQMEETLRQIQNATEKPVYKDEMQKMYGNFIREYCLNCGSTRHCDYTDMGKCAIKKLYATQHVGSEEELFSG